MSDFLTRLVQRQMSNTASIEPRIAERFAPTAMLPAPPTEEIPVRASASRFPADPPGQAREPLTKDSGSPAQFSHTEPARENDIAPPMVGRPSAGRAAALSTEIDDAEHIRSMVPSPATFPLTDGSPSRVAASADSSVREKPREFSAAAGKVTASMPVLVRRETAIDLETPEPPRRIAAPPRLEVKLSSGGELAPKRAAFDDQAPVQVSIGRIEVTATAGAPAPRRPAAPRKPAMSLDDYLARRQRGER